MTDYRSYLTLDGYAIFLFHGVIRKSRHRLRNYTRKHLLLDRFVEVLRSLRQAGAPISMSDVIAASRYGTALPARAFGVTFDDGFKNNATVAAPILEELGIPATFYVTTDFIGENGCSWIDRIEAAVEGAAPFQPPPPLSGGMISTADARRAFLDEVRRHVKTDARIDPYAFADAFCAHLGISDFAPDPDLDAKMTWEEIRSLDSHAGFTVGGHGRTHRILPYLAPSARDAEIDASLATIAAELGRPTVHYSYPDGCYSQEVIERLRAGGILCAPTADRGVNRYGDDLFRLKRIMVDE